MRARSPENRPVDSPPVHEPGATVDASERQRPPAVFPLQEPREGSASPHVSFARRVTSGARLLFATAVLYSLFFHLSVVRGSSMAPSIEDGDRILVEPWSYVFGGVNRGDVVVMQYPLDPSVDYIKRVIGLPGDRVTLADGHVWVNGELLVEPYVRDVDPTSYLSVVVDDESYFVLGDNRPRSSDSREFGLVPSVNVRGRVDLRLWPLSRVGFIQ